MKERFYSKIPLSQAIVALCEAKEIHHIVISPGSRNAPLTIGFTESPVVKCYSIVDERCAGFFALGIAQQLQKPVALVCTSGSALLNYYPAISEAFYSDIPLVVLSADRPIERIDIGDGQTIRQRNVFENHILYSANLYSEMVPESAITDLKVKQKQHESQKHNEREINIALNTAIELNGPVHINVPFYEPLYDRISEPIVVPKNIPSEQFTFPLSSAFESEILNRWNGAQRKLVLVGVNYPDAVDQKWIDILVNDPSVLLMTETTSNLRHSNMISCIDQLITPLNEKEFEQLRPDILLTFGGMVVSKRIKAFLRKYQPDIHWHVDVKKAYDTYFCLTEHVKMTPNYFFDTILDKTSKVKSNYQSYWLSVRKQRRSKHKEFLDTISFTDLSAFETIFEMIPNHSSIQLSNSSTVRYAQLFELNPTFSVFCNRGTSGIDGSTSTAIGASLISEKPTILITGDLSFFYDSNALWNNYIPKNFKIIVINNGGGGIFRILPGKEDTANFGHFFETKHQLTAENLCKMFGFQYLKALDQKELKSELSKMTEASEFPQLLEVFTPRKVNDRVLIDYFAHFV